MTRLLVDGTSNLITQLPTLSCLSIETEDGGIERAVFKEPDLVINYD